MKEYVLKILQEDKNTVDNLLSIDNKIQHFDLVYDEIYKIVYNTKILQSDLKGNYIVITDGQINTVVNILLNYIENIVCLNINHTTLAFYKWLVDRINNVSSKKIILDINNNYELYDKFDNFIIAGDYEFVMGICNLYEGKNIIKIKN